MSLTMMDHLMIDHARWRGEVDVRSVAGGVRRARLIAWRPRYRRDDPTSARRNKARVEFVDTGAQRSVVPVEVCIPAPISAACAAEDAPSSCAVGSES